MKKLYNNGYVVKGIYKDKFSSTAPEYRGIECYPSWPLSEYSDDRSKKLQDEIWNRWFAYQDILELVPTRDFLSRYIKHCEQLNIPTTILQIETPNNYQLAVDQLNEVELLGYDCIAGVNLSYLNLEPGYFEKYFGAIYYNLNDNKLCKTLNDVYVFWDRYYQLLMAGENLEIGPSPIPARLSIVKLD